ncbi:histidinol-phosphate transaminase [bacterium]|nr:histidinol-phosphate transaminase [bacterium]
MDFERLFRPGILATRPYAPGKPIGEVQRELGLDRVVKLASNENPEGPLPSVVEAVSRAAKDLNRYPDGSCFELTRALAADLGVEPGAVLLGNGCNEILDMFIRALVSPGETVVFAEPSFIVYPLTSRVQFESGRSVPLTADDRHDLPAMAAAVDGTTKLVIICNPNNPTGTYNTAAEFAAFMDAVPQDVIVLMDEAYYEYVTAPDYPQTIPMLARHPNLVVNRTFSKIHSLAGLRVGYGVGHPDLMAQLHKTREPFNVNSLAQAAALAVLKEKDATRERAEHNRLWREELEAGLLALGCEVTPSQTNFLLVRIPGRSAGEVQRELLKRGVIVRPMDAFGLGDGAMRVSVGLPEENRICLDALREILG